MNDPNIMYAAFLNYFANLVLCTAGAAAHIAFAIALGLSLFWWDSCENAFTSPYVMLGTLGSIKGIVFGTYLRKNAKEMIKILNKINKDTTPK